MKMASPDLKEREAGQSMRRLILFAISEHWRHYGYGPAFRDIGAVIESTSTGQIGYHLGILRQQNKVTWAEKDGHMLPRTLRVVGQ